MNSSFFLGMTNNIKHSFVRRWFDFDDGDGERWYQLNSMGDRLYPESALDVVFADVAKE
ncbi:MAG: hypothetical protein WBB28_08610 [Crinalium sp.]